MTEGQALHRFFNSILPAYAAGEVPRDVVFPYLTYELNFSAFGEGETALTVNLWFYTDSEAEPNKKAQELSAILGRGGKIIPCDGGAVWLKRGSPWCQNLTDATDRNIKRRYINVTAEFLTAD